MAVAMRLASISVAGLVFAALPASADDTKDVTDFVTRAANADLTAVAESQLARERSGDPRVNPFAQRLLEEDGKAYAALQSAASGSGVIVPTTLDESHQARVAALRDKTGAAFDKAFISDQAEIHSNALTLYADYMLLGDDAALKAYATRMIPPTEAQFKEAQRLTGE